MMPKQAARATPKGSLRLLCAGEPKNAKQPEFYVEPKVLPGTESGKAQKNGSRNLLPSLSAVGETRTRTGLLPLPPQSSVSTISPPPLEFGIAKIRTNFKSPNFFVIFYMFLI